MTWDYDDLSRAQVDRIIYMAWQDRITFEDIERSFGLPEAAVIKIMRRELKSSSFQLWRKRVRGRQTKHKKRFSKTQKSEKEKKIREQDFEL